MSNKAVFMDRDHTLIEDPGYLSDPSAVRLLPGVELALKSLAQAGYKLVVVTNQSGVARGLLTEETLERIHDELRRQLAERGARLDAIYYCPYHAEGTVEEYARESDLRKPQPGMILKAARELEIDPASSWMVGDSPRDVECGQRAGCRTVRLRVRGDAAEAEDEDVQADYTVRNLVDAARVILRDQDAAPQQRRAAGRTAVVTTASGEARDASVDMPSADISPDELPAAGAEPPDADELPEPAVPLAETMEDTEIRREMLRHLRTLVRVEGEEFSFTKLIGGIVQVLTLLTLLIALVAMMRDRIAQAQLWATIAVALQMMALSFFIMHRTR